MRLAFLVAWRSVSHSMHRVPFVVGSPQVMQGFGIGMVHRRSMCLCIRSVGIASGVLWVRRGVRIGGRCVPGVSLKVLVHLKCDGFDGVAVI